MATDPVYDLVVVGAGQAAAQLLLSLHRLGYAGSILLLGDEPELPYQRPPLSKDYLAGEFDERRLSLRPKSFYDKAGVCFEPNTRIIAIERKARRVIAENGNSYAYRKLALLTGARVRPLTVAGAGLDGVCYLRSLADASALKVRLAQARRLVVIGGGFIGLEIAAVARTRGLEVLVLEAQERLMTRALTPRMSDYFAQLHRRHGVELRLGCQVERIEERDGRVAGVVTGDGVRYGADLVNGIAVDAFGRSSDPDIFAAGDCASHPDPRLGIRLRLESVQNATDQASVLAQTLIGRPAPYNALPWFWSNQYDMRLQMAGLSVGHDREVLRGDPAQDSFSMFSFRGGKLLSVDSVNRPADHSLARRLLSQGNRLTPEQADDPDFALKDALRED